MINELFFPEVKVEKEELNKATFIIEPLSPGFGYTLGNALRRVLLSSLEGAGIRNVKIKGAPHEFTTLPGVREDVIKIILNLKNIKIKSNLDEPVTIVLSEKGKKVVTAKDFKTPTGVEIINKDQYIASLEQDNAELEIEATVIKGRGYLSEEEKTDKNLPLGTIVLDTVFSPVVKVGYWVENTRVGKIINLDKLILEIETNGTITPQEALNKASEILKEYFNVICQGGVKKAVEKEEKKPQKQEEDFSIEELNLSTRTTNALIQSGFKNVSQLTQLTEKELKEIKGLGAGGITEIKKAMKKLGLALREE